LKLTKAQTRAVLRSVADWIADQLGADEQPETSLRIPKVAATEEERDFARDEMRSMRTPKRKRRAA
jgi:hypothetical protein